MQDASTSNQVFPKIREFNTTGPCFPEWHYMLPPAERLQGAQLDRYINSRLYWVLHAPRQTGKTTFLFSWARELCKRDDIAACHVSVEKCQPLKTIDEAMPVLCSSLRLSAENGGLPVPPMPDCAPAVMLSTILNEWAKLVAPKQLVVLFDEVDVLEGEVVISFLRQLRDNFATRGVGKFPVSITLVGMRDLKDYITASKGGIPVNPGSPFNIKKDSASLGNFTKENIASLFQQHTDETGQKITQEALDYVWEQSQGQPWIVNSLFDRATLRILTADSRETVSLEHVAAAREQMILARETHLDALAWRLEDPRVRHVVSTLIVGEYSPNFSESDAVRLCLDLGLVSVGEDKSVSVANPIYREILAREITFNEEVQMPTRDNFRWQKPDGSLDINSLLKEFQAFWRLHSEVWEGRKGYTEAFPHLLVQAFLQRILNGGGQIDREYAAGRGRLDLRVRYKAQEFILEIKLLRDGYQPAYILNEGLKQILSYRDKLGTNAPCFLLLFDRRSKGKKLPWSKRVYWKKKSGVNIVGC